MRGFLKMSCMGCVGLVGLVVLVAAVASGVAWMSVQNEDVRRETLSRPLPGAGEAEPPGSLDEAPAATASPGIVVLDLSNGEFFVEKGEPGEPVHVEASFDTRSFELVEEWEDSGDGPWIYRVSFGLRGSGMMSLVRSIFGASQPRVEVRIPPDVPIALDGRLARCGAEVDLGGLWLTDVEFELKQFGLVLEVSEPLREPVERMRIAGSMGGVQLGSIGNASPRRLEIDVSMGGLDADLRGRWLVDSTVDISSRMSGGQIRVPRDVVVEGLDGPRLGLEPSPELRVPVLTITTATTSGELEFTD